MTPDGPRLESSISQDGALLLVGEIDSYTAPELEAMLAERPDGCIVDLAGVAFIDSSGLRVIVEAHRQREGRGGVTLRSPNPAVQRVFEISGIAGHFGIEA